MAIFTSPEPATGGFPSGYILYRGFLSPGRMAAELDATARTTRHAAAVRPRTTRPPRPAAPVRPRASPTARPLTLTPLQSVHPSPTTYVPGRGPGRRSANVPYANPAFREASQATRRAHYVNDSSNCEATPSRRRVRLPSEDSDSDDQPLAQRRRRRAPDPVPDSGPSTILLTPRTATTTSPSPPIATPSPVPSQADAPPAPFAVLVKSPPVHPSTLQQHKSSEAGPSPVTSPPEPSHVPPLAPSESAAGPSGSAAGPSQPPPPVHHYYNTTTPSEAGLQSQQDVPTSSLTMKGRLATL
ncbi:proline-rich receptor-like protein kinase PERK2 [Zingiber officinale]|uniref:proline-rich receptor-like protein kinase PERK2 n=1 Tax=Zingiber officinale TaxID=94328 RepID=UPI001C4AB56B|nr:proline-rich receptor-like protein kinase PERK2 [Zingiber officinale]